MNGTKASCGHWVIAVGAPGSHARMECEQYPCEACNERETLALNALLKAHPDHGKKAISINQCLLSRKIPKHVKVEYLNASTR